MAMAAMDEWQMMNSMLYLAWNSNSCTRPGHRGRKHKHHPTCKRQELQQRKEHIVNIRLLWARPDSLKGFF